MRLEAFEFARALDTQIEALENGEFHRKLGRSKVLQEEVYPISRLALHFKQPGLMVEVEAFEDSGQADGHISVSGFREFDFDVQVTCVHDYADSLRREQLVREGSTPGAGPISRDKKTGGVVSEVAATDMNEVIATLSAAIANLVSRKTTMAYPANTILLVTFDEVSFIGWRAWGTLHSALSETSKLEKSGFSSIFLFNCSTNELRQAA